MLVPIEAPPSDPSQKRAAHFSIRDYAFRSRVKDIAVNWPFPTQYLATCMEHKVKDLLPPFDPPPYPVRGFDADDLIFRCSCRRDFSVLAPTKKKLKLKLKLKHKRPTSVSFDNDDDGDDDERKRTSPPELTSNPTTVGVSDSMGSSKICPVCKTFASSSNTTLNAHIDRCLSEDTAAASAASGAVEGGHLSINRKIRSKPIGKHKANPPCKKRSMVEIYASSSCCTLEDLDRRNGTTWALDLGSAGQFSSATAESVSKSEIKRPVSDNENDGAAVYVDSNGTKVCILSKLNSSKSLDVAGAGSNVHHQQKHSNSKLFRVKFQIGKSGSSNPPPPVVKIKKRRKKDGSIAKLRRNFQYMHSDPSNKLNDKSVHVTSGFRRQREVNLPSSSAKTVRTPRTPPVPEEKEKNAFFFESCFASKKKVRSQRSSTMKKKSFSNLIVSPEKEATTTVSTELYHVVSDVRTTLLDDKDYTETVAGIEQPSAEEDPVVPPPYENGDNKKLISGTEAWVELFASSRPEPAVDDDANDDGKINSTIETASGGGDIQFRERGFHGSSRVVSCVEIHHKQPREERDGEEASGSPALSTISHPSTCSKDDRDSDFETVVGKSPPWPRPTQPPCCCSHIPETSRDSKPVLRLMGKNLIVVNKEDEIHHHHHHHQQQRQPEIPSSMSLKESSEQQQQQHHNNIDPYRRPVGYHHHHNHHHMYSLNGGRSSGADGCPPCMQISGNRRYFPQNHPTPNMIPVPQDLFMRTQKRSYLPHQNLFYNNNSHRLPGGDGAGVCVGVGVGSPASPMPMMIPIYHPFQPREVSNYNPGNIVNIPTYQYHHHHNHPYEPAPANLPHRRVPHLTPPAYFNSPPILRH